MKPSASAFPASTMTLDSRVERHSLPHALFQLLSMNSRNRSEHPTQKDVPSQVENDTPENALSERFARSGEQERQKSETRTGIKGINET